MPNWDDLIGAAKDVASKAVKEYVARPDSPVATGQGGNDYVEGQPAYVSTGGIKPAYLIAGGVGLVVLVLLVLRR